MSNGRGGLFTGFESFCVPTDDSIKKALKNGFVAVDTNVLLNLYRYNDSTVDDLLLVLNKVGDRLFVPHQVVREFWRNRLSILGSPASAIKTAQDALTKNQKSTSDAVSRWAKDVALDTSALDELLAAIGTAFDHLSKQVASNAPTRVDETTPTDSDPLLKRIANLLEGKVGSPLDAAAWTAAIAEGERRVTDREPPGYMDTEKLDSDLPERASGDYLVWMQLLLEGEISQLDLVLVTADTKEDWWNKTARGKSIGPRQELIEEYFDKTGHRLFLLEPAVLLSHSAALGVGVNQKSVEEIERIQNEIPSSSPWNIETVNAVLEALDNEGCIQADVIREAASNGGRLSRERVYELDGRSDEQMLRGFTRPVARITSQLQAQGVVPDGVPPMLQAIYETGVKTSHFGVPREIVSLLSGDKLTLEADRKT